jgi:hypothetical protein
MPEEVVAENVSAENVSAGNVSAEPATEVGGDDPTHAATFPEAGDR